MRLLTWNMDGATFCRTPLSAAKWKTFLEISPDVAMLQEVNNVPPCVGRLYHVKYVPGRFFGGTLASYGTAVLAKKSGWMIGPEVQWRSRHSWVNEIQETFPGWLVGHEVKHTSGECYTAASVHAPAFPVWPVVGEISTIMDGVNCNTVKLAAAKKLWFTEILWSLLEGTNIDDGNWIVAGDFNSSVLF